MNTKRKILQIILLAVVLSLFSCFSVSAKIYGGTTNGVTWELDLNSGEMTVSGSGKMPDYLNYADTPWKEYVMLAKTITVDGAFTSIGDNAFIYASDAVSVFLPDTVTEIGQNAFEYCKSLTDINLPESLKTIGANAFANCRALSEIDFPKSLSTISPYAFSACTSLESADLAQTKITELCEGVFSGCLSLEAVVLPDMITSIGEGAFFNCVTVDSQTGDAVKGLESINIPSTVLTIGSKAFFNCQLLDKMEMNAYPSVSADTFYNVPQKYTVTFKNCDGSELFSYETGVNTIASYAGETPTLESTAQYDFSFKGWDRAFEAVLGNAVYTAVYTEKLRSYTITWVVDGTAHVDKNKDWCYYGKTPKFYYGTPTATKPSKEGYTFVGWMPNISPVTGDAAYTARFVIEGVGDITFDGAIDELDKTALANHLAGIELLMGEKLLRADFHADEDADGTVINVKDLIALTRYIALNS